MQAIVTKYLGPRGVRGARIKATAEGGSITIGYPHELHGYEERHRKAAEALCDKMGWGDKEYLLCGTLPNNQFVFIHGREFIEAEKRKW